MPTDPNQLELDLDLPVREDGGDSPEQRPTKAPPARDNLGGGDQPRTADEVPGAPREQVPTLPGQPRPRYASLDDAPEHLVEHAIQDMLPWVQEFVFRGSHLGQIRRCAEAHATRQGLPPSAVPELGTLIRLWRQYRDYGVLGLVALEDARARGDRALQRPEANHG